MRFFHHRSVTNEPKTPASSPPETEKLTLPGDQPCTERGCSATTGLRCEYQDHRGRQCNSAWCPDHRLVVGDRLLCRRHAGVVISIPSDWKAAPLPDVDNRAPSLVNWLARELDAAIRLELLGEVRNAQAQLTSEPLGLIFIGVGRKRAWERAWTLSGNEGFEYRVALVSEEANPTEVAVAVGAKTIGKGSPPWIGEQHEESPSPDESARRQAFNSYLLELVQSGIAEERHFQQVLREGETNAG